MRRSLVIAFLSFFILFLISCEVGYAQTTTVTWNGGTGNWSSAGNWTPGVVPNNSGLNTYSVQIDNGNGTSSVVYMNQLNATVNNIALDANDTLHLNSGSTLTSLGLIQAPPLQAMGSVITHPGSILNANIVTAGPSNITIGGTLNTSYVSVQGSGANLTLQPGSVLNNSGSVSLSSDGTQLQINGTFNNLPGATLVGGDIGFIYGTGILNNSGTFTYFIGGPSFGTVNNFESGTLDFYSSGLHADLLNNAGTILLWGGDSNSLLSISGSSDTHNTGTISLGESGSIGLSGGGNYVQGQGTTILERYSTMDFNGGNAQILGGQLITCGNVNGDLLMAGTIIPGPFGCSGSQPTISGNYIQASSGAYTANIGGYFLGDDYNQIQISGNAALNGILNLVVSGFAPNAGDSFVLMTYGSHSGTFRSINWTGLPTGLYFQISYNQNDLIATVRPVPEPATLLLVGSGVLAAIYRKRRTKT